MRTYLLAFVALLLLAFAGTALAVDGRLEINQTCATQTGCFAGDAAGSPVSISSSAGGRSFVLTSDLTTTNASVDAIDVQLDSASLDLNGFQIAGPVACTGESSAINCGAGTGRGIDAAVRFRTSVSNGTVIGFGSFGVAVGAKSQVRRIRVEGNGDDGINTGVNSTVSESTASVNAGDGISVSNASLVERSTSYKNRDNGIRLSLGCTAISDVAANNGLHGIKISHGSTVRDPGSDRLPAISG